MNPTHIFLTHGHVDHWGDIVDLAKRTGAHCVAIVELANELGEQGVENVSDPNVGGTVEFDGGWVRLTPAWHTSTSPGGTVTIPAGLVINLGGKTVYHLGDTGLFSDLQLVKARDHVDVALIPIGGHYTMDRHDAVTAADLVGADTVIPCHYNTFPADRDRRPGVQVGRRVQDLVEGRGSGAGRDALCLGVSFSSASWR